MTALVLGLNPIYYPLSNTFMTDVPFTALSVLTALFLLRSLKSGSDVDLLIGTGFAVAATLCRQFGILVPVAFAATLVWKRGMAGRYVTRAAVPLVASIAALLALQFWLNATGRLPELYRLKSMQLLGVLGHPPQQLAYIVGEITWFAALYLGCFSLPVILLTLPGVQVADRNVPRLVLAGCAGLGFVFSSTIVLLVAGRLMPLWHDHIVAQGIGPLILRDTYLLKLPNLSPSLGTGFWLAVTAICVLGGIF